MTRKHRNRRRANKPKPAASTAKPAQPETAPILSPPASLPWPGFGFLAAKPAALITLGATALVLLIAAAFLPATWAGFVWDDVVITKARPVESPSGLWQIWFAPRTIENEGHYWPVLYTTYWLEHKLWGFHPTGYHIDNLLIHAGVSVLLWRLLVRLAVPGAWLAAAVFAVHPVHTEPVVWAIGRKDLLAALFYFGSFLAYVRFTESGQQKQYLTALALFVLGLLSKSIVVTLPVSLLVWHWWMRGRISGAEARRTLPFFAVGLAITLINLWHYRIIDPTAFDYSWLERSLIAARALWFYAGKLVWPAELAVIYPRWNADATDPLLWACLLGALALAAGLWFFRDRIGRGPLAGTLFFVITLSPNLGFLDYGYMLFAFVADRYQYLAGAGVIVLGAAAAVRGLGMVTSGRTIGVYAGATVSMAALAILATLSWRQAGIYQNDTTFYQHIIALNPQARFAHLNLGNQYQKEGRFDEALELYAIDYRLAQTQPSSRDPIIRNLIGMGSAYQALGQLDKAETHFARAAELGPEFPPALEYLGAFRIRQQQYQQALDLFETLVQLKPGTARFYVGKGVALAGLQRSEEALRQYDRALAINPLLEEARNNRANLLRTLNKPEE